VVIPLSFPVQQILVFLLGCCLGSFYNVVIHRLPRGMSLVRPASHCPVCLHPVSFYDNLPVISYLVLMGRCRRCKAHISPRYPLVEILTGGLAVLLFRKYGLHQQVFIEFFFVSLLIIITFIDLDTYTVPDVLSLSGIVAGFAFSFFSFRLSWMESLLGIVLGGGLFYLIAVGYQAVRKQEGLGGGDIKLLGMIGAFVGWSGVVFTILVASVAGVLVGFIVMRRTRKGLSTMVPFGPFLSLGAVCYIFFGQSFYAWYLGDLLKV
jgi:leader peptidase (prepilin peptidase)/N-methyltransferase